jgi:hypothetical protein
MIINNKIAMDVGCFLINDLNIYRLFIELNLKFYNINSNVENL